MADTSRTRTWSGLGFLQLIRSERNFVLLLSLGFFLAGMVYDIPSIAMWVGFAFAGYSAVANDSIQTLGTFIASNRGKPWWVLWLFIGGIFLLTSGWSWWSYGGDVSFGRLASKGFETAPTDFYFLQIAAPLFLMVLTRLRMPVSTTFLLLSSFATSGSSIWSVITKSLSGYVIAFVLAIVIWSALGPWMKRRFVGEAAAWWRPAQWCTTGLLWSVWLQQDAANIAVYLPRALSLPQLVVFAVFIFAGLGVLFAMGGERIQEVVDEKSSVVDVRAATVIDLVYTVILYVFKVWSNIPMSTTWVFVGLLAGRELGMTLSHSADEGRSLADARRLMFRDLFSVSVGFAIALLLAMAINPVTRAALLGR